MFMLNGKENSQHLSCDVISGDIAIKAPAAARRRLARIHRHHGLERLSPQLLFPIGHIIVVSGGLP